MTRLLAFGDVHLGAGGSLGRAPGDRLADQERVLERVFSLGALREVDAFLMCGDLFEGPTISPAQLEAFIRPFEQFEGEIPLIAIPGNGRHDLAQQPANALQPLRHVPGVHIYSRPGFHQLTGCTIACLPWVSPAGLIARDGQDVDRDRINQHAAELLVSIASGIVDPGLEPTVLMLHGSITGASLPTGILTDDLREPVLDLYALEDLRFAAIVASHIHVPQYVDRDGWVDLDLTEPGGRVFYTGSPMPLNFGEAETLHGVWILDVDEAGTRAEFVPIESRPLRQSHLDLAALETDDPIVEFDGILDANTWPDVDDAIVKITLHATRSQQRRIDLTRLREAVLGAGAHTVKIEVDTVREERSRVAGVTEDLEPLDAFDAWAAANDIVAATATPAREQMTVDLEQVGA